MHKQIKTSKRQVSTQSDSPAKSVDMKIQTKQLRIIICKFFINLPLSQLIQQRICTHYIMAYRYFKRYLSPYQIKSQQQQICQIKAFIKRINQCLPYPFNTPQLSPNAVLKQMRDSQCYTDRCGLILLSSDLKETLILQTQYHKGTYGFPKGKIEQGQNEKQCAIRETFQQTGYRFEFNDNNHIVVNGMNKATFFIIKVKKAEIELRVPNYQIGGMVWIGIETAIQNIEKGLQKQGKRLNNLTRKGINKLKQLLQKKQFKESIEYAQIVGKDVDIKYESSQDQLREVSYLLNPDGSISQFEYNVIK